MRERLQQLIDTNEFEFLKTMSEEDIWKFAFAIFYVFSEREERTAHCKDCKWRKDSDRVFRRGIGAESENVLDEIRVEIDAHRKTIKDMADTDDWYAGKLSGHDCDIEIIDKYRESEES